LTDRLTPEQRSRLMSRVRAYDTGPELALRRALFASGMRGWRLHVRSLPGKPDVAFSRWKVAVFVDGTFWHGHPSKFSPGRLPKPWEEKIARNCARDQRVDEELRLAGWMVIRLWDTDVKRDPMAQARLVRTALLESGFAHADRSRKRVESTARGELGHPKPVRASSHLRRVEPGHGKPGLR
jgi:DNA mismatch endonuclease (patch repair protein)